MSTLLKETRIAAGLSLEEIASKLNIRKQYLIALEEGNFHIIPGKVYVDGYLRLYSNYLGIELLTNDRVETKQQPLESLNIQIANQRNFKNNIITISILILLLVTVFHYFSSYFSTKEDIQSKFNNSEDTGGNSSLIERLEKLQDIKNTQEATHKQLK